MEHIKINGYQNPTPINILVIVKIHKQSQMVKRLTSNQISQDCEGVNAAYLSDLSFFCACLSYCDLPQETVICVKN